MQVSSLCNQGSTRASVQHRIGEGAGGRELEMLLMYRWEGIVFLCCTTMRTTMWTFSRSGRHPTH